MSASTSISTRDNQDNLDETRRNFVFALSKKKESLEKCRASVRRAASCAEDLHRHPIHSTDTTKNSPKNPSQTLSPIIGHVEMFEEISDYGACVKSNSCPGSFDLSGVKLMETLFCQTLVVELQPITPQLPAREPKQLIATTPVLPTRMVDHIDVITRFTPEIPVRLLVRDAEGCHPTLSARRSQSVFQSSPREIEIEVPPPSEAAQDAQDNTVKAPPASPDPLASPPSSPIVARSAPDCKSVHFAASPVGIETSSQQGVCNNNSSSSSTGHNYTPQKNLNDSVPKTLTKNSHLGFVAVYDMSGMTPRTAMNIVSSLAHQTSQLHRQNEMALEHKAAVRAMADPIMRKQYRRFAVSHKSRPAPSAPPAPEKTTDTKPKSAPTSLLQSKSFLNLVRHKTQE
eukprot:c7495_g1_i2.p1 GENE.c7495_g1_i2~~c7495_g1_i2.p1  ORF type:complete len:407 (+),score=87.66 c7495_g1_i2:24-1223(+)